MLISWSGFNQSGIDQSAEFINKSDLIYIPSIMIIFFVSVHALYQVQNYTCIIQVFVLMYMIIFNVHLYIYLHTAPITII
jgi:hypothetical protein